MTAEIGRLALADPDLPPELQGLSLAEWQAMNGEQPADPEALAERPTKIKPQ